MPFAIGDTLETTLKVCGECSNMTPDDYVLATGKQYSVRDFVNAPLKPSG